MQTENSTARPAIEQQHTRVALAIKSAKKQLFKRRREGWPAAKALNEFNATLELELNEVYFSDEALAADAQDEDQVDSTLSYWATIQAQADALVNMFIGRSDPLSEDELGALLLLFDMVEMNKPDSESLNMHIRHRLFWESNLRDGLPERWVREQQPALIEKATRLLSERKGGY